MRQCKGCQIAFEEVRKDQEYHSRQCATHSRIERWREKHAQKVQMIPPIERVQGFERVHKVPKRALGVDDYGVELAEKASYA